jgi:hypothetical protein
MVGSTIGSKIITSVTLGSAAGPGIYLSPLTITPSGTIAPSDYDTTGLSASIVSGYVLSRGTIMGGLGKAAAAGSAGDVGGGGVGLASGSLINDGTIGGGTGGTAETGNATGGNGGFGIDLVAAFLANTGSIQGGYGGLSTDGLGGTGGTGAILESGIAINGGTITGGAGGPGLFGGAGGIGLVLANGSLTNLGIVTGGASGFEYLNDFAGVGVAVYAGNLTNTGTINGGSSTGVGSGANGVTIAGGSVVNDGQISGGSGGNAIDELGTDAGGAGLALGGGNLTNNGVITGGEAGYLEPIRGPEGVGVTISGGTLINYGTIAGATRNPYLVDSGSGAAGVDLSAGELLNYGTIIGGLAGHFQYRSAYGGVGVNFHNGGTLTNGGLIAGGTSDAAIADAVDFGGGASRLILDPGATFSGAVVASAAYNNVLELAAGRGQDGAIAGLGNTVNGFQTTTIDPGSSWLIAGNSAGLAAGQTIDGFAKDDAIELTGITATGSTYSGGVLTLRAVGGPVMLNLPGTFTTSEFIVSNISANTYISITCFRAGTRIHVADGDVAVERLSVGEQILVLTRNGDLVPRPIVWIGHRSVDCRHHPRPIAVWPVRIRAGAFARNVPCRDLFLSPDHAVFVDEVLIPVKHLINGRNIEQMPMDEVTYFHIELRAHSVLFADGLTTESYLDTGDRSHFANGRASIQLHPDFASRVWDADGCAPLVVCGSILDSVRRRLDVMAKQHARRVATQAQAQKPIRAT